MVILKSMILTFSLGAEMTIFRLSSMTGSLSGCFHKHRSERITSEPPVSEMMGP